MQYKGRFMFIHEICMLSRISLSTYFNSNMIFSINNNVYKFRKMVLKQFQFWFNKALVTARLSYFVKLLNITGSFDWVYYLQCFV